MGAQLTATDEELQRLAHHRMVVRQCARRYRARRQNDARCLRIEISNAEQTLDALVRIGVLAEERRNDNRAIEAAISALCRRGYRAIKAERENRSRKQSLWKSLRHLDHRRAGHTSPEATPSLGREFALQESSAPLPYHM
jgi:hypothetical protein